MNPLSLHYRECTCPKCGTIAEPVATLSGTRWYACPCGCHWSETDPSAPADDLFPSPEPEPINPRVVRVELDGELRRVRRGKVAP